MTSSTVPPLAGLNSHHAMIGNPPSAIHDMHTPGGHEQRNYHPQPPQMTMQQQRALHHKIIINNQPDPSSPHRSKIPAIKATINKSICFDKMRPLLIGIEVLNNQQNTTATSTLPASDRDHTATNTLYASSGVCHDNKQQSITHCSLQCDSKVSCHLSIIAPPIYHIAMLLQQQY